MEALQQLGCKRLCLGGGAAEGGAGDAFAFVKLSGPSDPLHADVRLDLVLTDGLRVHRAAGVRADDLAPAAVPRRLAHALQALTDVERASPALEYEFELQPDAGGGGGASVLVIGYLEAGRAANLRVPLRRAAAAAEPGAVLALLEELRANLEALRAAAARLEAQRDEARALAAGAAALAAGHVDGAAARAAEFHAAAAGLINERKARVRELRARLEARGWVKEEGVVEVKAEVEEEEEDGSEEETVLGDSDSGYETEQTRDEDDD
jgi:hypothetical protein